MRRAARALALAFGLGACAQPAPRPDVLLVTFDTLRADHCSIYGYERPTTPELDRLAATGVRFTEAYAPMPSTAPSLATLMTSRYPLAHGVVRNGDPLGPDFETLAERLRGAGYATAAFVSSVVLHRSFGLARGFEHYDDDLSASEATLMRKRWEGIEVAGGKTDRRADATTDRAVAWTEAARGAGRGPLFAWVHYMAPHEPYAPPPRFGDPFGIARAPRGSLEEAVARYDTEIAFADRELGRLGIDASEFAGRDLGALLRGAEAASPARPLFFQRTDYGRAGRIPPVPLYEMGRATFGAGVRIDGPQFGVRAGPWKLLETPAQSPALELYHLASDPRERLDLAAVHPALAARLSRWIGVWRSAQAAAGAPSQRRALTPAERAALESLGYLAPEAGDPPP